MCKIWRWTVSSSVSILDINRRAALPSLEEYMPSLSIGLLMTFSESASSSYKAAYSIGNELHRPWSTVLDTPHRVETVAQRSAPMRASILCSRTFLIIEHI